MKGLFKFTTAALALLTMASCSNDDLFGNGESAQTPEEGALVVEMEDLIDHVSTRAAFVPESDKKNTIYWQGTDVIKVQDESLTKYDRYKFDSKKGSFINANSKTFVGEPKYALFPGDDMIGKWEYTDDQNLVIYNIPNTIPFSEDKNIVGDGTIAYKSNLPMWGEAAAEGEGVKVNLHYLTAVLRVYLKNASSNITNFKVEAFADQACTKKLDITGDATAVISKNGEVNEDAQLDINTNTETNNTIIVYNINYNATSDAYLYIPLVAQKYGALKFYYSTDFGANYKLIKTAKPMTLKRQTVYRLSLEEFEVAGNSLNSINALLAGQKDATADVNIKTQKTTKSYTDDDILKIPAGMKANINLTLQGLVAGSENTVSIESEDGNYAGTLVIDASAAATASDLSNIYINLPKADVVFVGDFSATDFGQYQSSAIVDDKLIVKSLTFSNGESETPVTIANNVFVNKESTEAITVDKLATVAKIELQPGNANVGEIVVNGTVTGNINADKANNIAAITVNGKVGGNIWANGDVTIEGNAKKVVSREGDVTVGDAASLGGDISASKGKVTYTSENPLAAGKVITTDELELGGKANFTTVTVKNLTLKGEAKVGNVTIANEGSILIDVDDKSDDATGDCEAITGTLTVGKKAAITLTQGYINTLTPSATAAADACTLTFGENEGYTAIKTVSNNYIKPANASTWNGKVLPNATYVGTQVWTACQLASVNLATANLTLQNDIDLGGETAWAMPALGKDFIGFDMMNYGVLTETTYPTISNVKILNKDSKNADIDNAGLFSTITGTIAVKDFNITNASLTLTGEKKNAGILAGSVTGTGLWVTNVNVSGSIETTAKFDNVGGLIGQSKEAWIGWKYPSTQDNKTVSVKLTKLQGRYNVGGVIGNGTSTTYFNKAKVEIAENGITVVDAKTFNVDVASNDNAGSVGMLLGKGNGNVRIDDANIVADRIVGKKEALGFKAKFTSADNKIYFYYGGTEKNAVGIVGGTYYVGETATANGAKADAAPAAAADKANPNRYVLSGKYADWDK